MIPALQNWIQVPWAAWVLVSSALGVMGLFFSLPIPFFDAEWFQAAVAWVQESDAEVTSSSGTGKAKRLVMVGAGCFAILGTIGILFGYFRLNHATRGFYSGRLQTLALLIFVILILLVVFFVQRFS